MIFSPLSNKSELERIASSRFIFFELASKLISVIFLRLYILSAVPAGALPIQSLSKYLMLIFAVVLITNIFFLPCLYIVCFFDSFDSFGCWGWFGWVKRLGI